jgi:hypothetical protein
MQAAWTMVVVGEVVPLVLVLLVMFMQLLQEFSGRFRLRLFLGE